MDETFANTKKPDAANTEELIKKNNEWYLPPSKFHFLNAHRNLRPGLMHVLLAATGAGKTSLSRSILAEISQTHKVVFYSTEETLEQFQTQLGYSKKVNFENLSFIHETDVLKKCKNSANIEGFIRELSWAIDSTGAQVLFFDNATTSVFYDQNKRAMDTAIALRGLMVRKHIPFFVVCHTTSTVRDNMWFDSSQMRGVRTLANTAEYLYCLFRFRSVQGGFTRAATFIYCDKSRMHGGAKEIYRLFYDLEARDYSSDQLDDYARAMEFLKIARK